MSYEAWKLYVDGTEIPTPAQGSGLKRQWSGTWSDDTGRDSSATMQGTFLGTKFKANLQWHALPFNVMAILENAVTNHSFVDLTVTNYSGTPVTYNGYFGDMSASDYSWAQGMRYATDVSVNFIER